MEERATQGKICEFDVFQISVLPKCVQLRQNQKKYETLWVWRVQSLNPRLENFENCSKWNPYKQGNLSIRPFAVKSLADHQIT